MNTSKVHYVYNEAVVSLESVSRSYLYKWIVSELQVVKHGCVISVQIHQVFVAALLRDASLSHKDHFVAVHQVLI